MSFGLSISFLLFLVPSVIFAVEYYVSPSGSDLNSGMIDSPFKTIGKGVTKLKSGDIIYVRTGRYVERIYVSQSGTEVSPITIKAFPGEFPVIDGEDKLPDEDWGYLILLEGDYINVSDIEIKNSNTSGRYLGGAGVILNGEHDKVSNLKVHHIWENGILASGDYSIVEDCTVWQCVLSNSINPGTKGWSTGLSAARSPKDGITTNAILRRNIVYNNWGEGLSSYEAEGTIIEDNIVYDNWSGNLYISDTRDALIQSNIIYNTPNNIVNKRSGFVLADEKSSVPRSANNVVINNILYNTDFSAFWWTEVPGSGLDNVLIANNTMVNGQLIIGPLAIDEGINKKATICNNIFTNENGEPWLVRGTLTNLTFTNNLWSIQPPNGLASAGDVIGNPELVKTGNTDEGELSPDYFKLHETSPAINRGIVINKASKDFYSKFRDESPDIGAIEFVYSSNIIDIYPNPSEGIFHISHNMWNEKIEIIEVYNIFGARIFSNSPLFEYPYIINLNSFPNGIYILITKSKNKGFANKIIIN